MNIEIEKFAEIIRNSFIKRNDPHRSDASVNALFTEPTRIECESLSEDNLEYKILYQCVAAPDIWLKFALQKMRTNFYLFVSILHGNEYYEIQHFGGFMYRLDGELLNDLSNEVFINEVNMKIRQNIADLLLAKLIVSSPIS